MENKTYKLLLIDDEQEAYAVVKNGLSRHGFEVFYESNPENALNSISTHKPDTILLDIMFSGKPRGKELLEEIKESKYNYIPVIMLTGNMETYKEKDYPGAAFPFVKKELKKGAAAHSDLSKQIKDVLNKSDDIAPDDPRFGFVVGNTPQMRNVCKTILDVAPTNATVLITGETGTGKEKVAEAVHCLSNRKGKQFVTVNCSEFPEENLLISGLFGHEKGAFTGATETRKGIFETASGGTVFLDEIGEATSDVQAKLLRVVQNGEITRLGSSSPIKADMRIIAATNKSFEEEVKAGRFREDLYYRLNVIKIHLPPLRERSDDDLKRLFIHFVNTFNEEHKKSISADTFNDELFKAFREYNWPGNIREFEKKIESAIIRKKEGNVLLPGDFNLIQKETLPIDVNSVSNKFLEGQLGIEYYTDQLKGDSRRAVILDVYNKYCQRNGKPPTGKVLAGIFKTTPGNMRQKLTEEHIELEELKKQNN